MKNRNAFAGGACALAVVAAVSIWAVSDRGEDPLAEDAGQIGQSGMVTHIDPVTGEIVAPPANGSNLQLGNGFNSSHEGLELRSSPVPGGGEGFEANGRFQSAVIVSAESETVTVECMSAHEADTTDGGGE